MEKVEALIALDAEESARNCLQQINSELAGWQYSTIQVAINLIDDVEGSWSSYAVTDYMNKFELDGLIKRNFCTPIFWTSETVNEEIIVRRTKEYVYRTIHWVKKGRPETLYESLEQEVYVIAACGKQSSNADATDFEMLENYYHQNLHSTDYNLILNFFYGDEETEKLNFPSFGIPNNGGFEYAEYIAEIRMKEAGH